MQRKHKNIAMIVQATKLPGDPKGLDRAVCIAKALSQAGYNVDLITSTFQHWEKKHRTSTWSNKYQQDGYKVVFLQEPGYTKNLDLKRIYSHEVFNDNLRSYLEASGKKYDLVWAQIPPNNIAATAAEYAHENKIPFIVDVNDLWPEAMKMAINIPIVSDIAFSGFARDAKKVYQLADAAIGTSEEYANHPNKFRKEKIRNEIVYVGNNLERFDKGVTQFASSFIKPDDEVWFAYAGTLGCSYDIDALSLAASKCEAALNGKDIKVRVKILGDGPDRPRFESYAKGLNAPVDFLGYMDYEEMAGLLSICDVTVNSLVKDAPQSIVSKIGDYLAAGKPMINTGSSQEFRNKVAKQGFGVNVEPGNADDLCRKMLALIENEKVRESMGEKARTVAENEFDRKETHKRVIALIDELLKKD